MTKASLHRLETHLFLLHWLARQFIAILSYSWQFVRCTLHELMAKTNKNGELNAFKRFEQRIESHLMIENRIIIYKGREDRRLSFSIFRTHCRRSDQFFFLISVTGPQ